VRLTGVPGRFAYSFRTVLHFADVGTHIPLQDAVLGSKH